jgi:hypothetical protein
LVRIVFILQVPIGIYYSSSSLSPTSYTYMKETTSSSVYKQLPDRLYIHFIHTISLMDDPWALSTLRAHPSPIGHTISPLFRPIDMGDTRNGWDTTRQNVSTCSPKCTMYCSVGFTRRIVPSSLSQQEVACRAEQEHVAERLASWVTYGQCHLV